jgi:hypothetical protein
MEIPMAALALLVAMILFFPAILAPVALGLTFMRRQRWHVFFILPVSVMASSISGPLILSNVSTGGTVMGLIGLTCSLLAVWRWVKSAPPKPLRED